LVTLVVVLVERALLRGVGLLARLLVEVLAAEEAAGQLGVALDRSRDQPADVLPDRVRALEVLLAGRDLGSVVAGRIDHRSRGAVNAVDVPVQLVERSWVVRVSEEGHLLSSSRAQLRGGTEHLHLVGGAVELGLGRALAGLIVERLRLSIGRSEGRVGLLGVALDHGGHRLSEGLPERHAALELLSRGRDTSRVVSGARAATRRVAAVEALASARRGGPRPSRGQESEANKPQVNELHVQFLLTFPVGARSSSTLGRNVTSHSEEPCVKTRSEARRRPNRPHT